LNVTGGEGAPTAADGAVAASGATTSEAAPEPEAPKQDFSIGISQTDAEKEAEKRAARAKRFGITEDDEAKKLAERAKKFGLDSKEAVVKGLDSALPERKQKRGREDRQGGRAAKRQTPDRRTEAPKSKPAGAPAKQPAGRIIDDPVEKAKAEARAKRFAAA
jgi:SAP domain-containing ribonucleoprotein